MAGRNERAERIKKNKALAKEAETAAVSQKPSAKARRQKVYETARKYALKHQSKTTQLQDNSTHLPKFTSQELTLGKTLGKGGFGTVFEIRAFLADGATTTPAKNSKIRTVFGKLKRKKNGKEVDLSTGSESATAAASRASESRQFIATHCLRQKTGDARYAVKFINAETMSSDKGLFQAILDTSNEARFLSALEHPNIIKLRATSTGDDMFHENPFLVMDRLYDTLEARLLEWDKRSRQNEGLAAKLLDRDGAKVASLWEDRMVAAYDLAAALQYMHSNRIIHRDIKPENIGFDIRDDIKIFDFGLARELPNMDQISEDKEEDDEEGFFKMTGFCGSPRYMPPEIAKKRKYNETADVYSFAILLWEMLSLEVPFSGANLNYLVTRVWTKSHKRPEINSEWSESLKAILKQAWDHNKTKRPSMAQVASVIRNECVMLRGGDETGLGHERRRSTHVFQYTSADLEKLREEFKKASSSRRLISSGRPSLAAERQRSSRNLDLQQTGRSFRNPDSNAA